MVSQRTLALLPSTVIAAVTFAGCAGGGLQDDWHIRVRVVHRGPNAESFVDGPYCVEYRVTQGLPRRGESWALLSAPAEGRVTMPSASEEWYKDVHEAAGPSLSDFRLDLDYRIGEADLVSGKLEVDRYYPYRRHWVKRIKGVLGEPVTMVLDTPGQMPVTMELRVSKIAECG